MEVSKVIEQEIREFLANYWDTYFQGDLTKWASYLTDDYKNIGTTKEEIWNNKKEILDYTMAVLDQMVGNAEVRKKEVQVISYDPYFMAHEIGDLYVKAEDEWIFYAPIRLSTLLQKNSERWQVLHQHGSFPDSKTQEGEAFGFEELKAENEKLQNAVKERTKELESKTRELEIEGALQRIRAEAVSMKQSSDLLDVVVTLRNEFINLGHEAHYFWHMLWQPDIYEKAMTSGDGTRIGFVMKLPRHIHGDIPLLADWEESDEPTVVYAMDVEEALNYIHKMVTLGDFQSIDPQAPTEEDIRNIGGLTFVMARTTHGEIGYSLPGVVANPPSEDIDILVSFASAFDLAHLRFLDLQKSEEQAKEVKIELALEKVRSRTMSMQQSGEIIEVANVLYEQLSNLGGELWGTGFAFCREGSEEDEYWFVGQEGVMPSMQIPNSVDPAHREMYLGWVDQLKILTIEKGDKPLQEHYSYMLTVPDVQPVFQGMLEAGITFPKWQQWHAAYHTFGYILVITTQPYKETGIFIRFAKVFEQAYTRFLDLKKAEAQAREAQIEAALERVRSNTMAMHNSGELAKTSYVLFEEFKALGKIGEQLSIGIFNEEENMMELYSTLQGKEWKETAKVDLSEPTVMQKIHQAWKQQEKSLLLDLTGQNLKKYNDYRSKLSNLKYEDDRWVIHVAFFSKGVLTFSAKEPNSVETIQLLERFASVFEQTFTRFLDLQKAEAQAREARIESALERVRSSSMAMRKSDELADLSLELVKQVQALGVTTWFCAFNIYNEDNNGSLEWGSNGENVFPSYRTPREGVFLDYYNAGQAGEKLLINEIGEDKCQAHYEYLCSLPGVGEKLLEMKAAGISFPKSQIDHVAFFKYGYVLFITYESVPEAHAIFERFARVFEQSYTRFLDLQKAEAQAREAQVEAALERVRSTSMAMHDSEDLHKVIVSVYNQLVALGLKVHSTQIVESIHDESGLSFWNAANGQVYPKLNFMPYNRNIHFTRFKSAVENRESFYSLILTKRQKDSLFRHYFTDSSHEDVPKSRIDFIFSSPGLALSAVVGKHTALFVLNYERIPYSNDENGIIQRFAQVFEQAYTRFLDLKKAEAQAREAQIEAALERVRSKTMAMHNSEDVSTTVVTLFDEVLKLDLNQSIRCGIGILKDRELMETWSVTNAKDGAVDLKVGLLDMNIHPLLVEIKNAWQNDKRGVTYVLSGKELLDYYRTLNEAPEYPLHTDLSKLPKETHHNSFCFSSGVLFAFTDEPISKEATSVLHRFSGVFGQTYTRYLDLKKAEAQAREAQIEVAVERVRAEAMAMHSTSDFEKVSKQLLEQVNKMGLEGFTGAQIILIDEEGIMTTWDFSSPGNIGDPKSQIIKYDSQKYAIMGIEILNKWKAGEPYFVMDYDLKKLKAAAEEWEEIDPNIAKEFKKAISGGHLTHQWDACGRLSNGLLAFDMVKPPNDDVRNITIKMTHAFEQAYTRFLDLERAEAQTREAQIEAALERVRAKAMAMHSSEDLSFTVDTFFTELKLLNVQPRRCGVGIIDRDSRVVELSATATASNSATKIVTASLTLSGHPVLNEIFENWLNQKEYQPVLRGKEIQEYYQAMNSEVSYPNVEENETEYGYYFYFKEGGVFAWTKKELPDRDIEIFRRFNSALSLTYRRYIDLLEAEAQAREAQIEASLERVRSKAMAMRSSEDIGEATTVLFKEIEKLEIETMRCGILIIHENKVMDVWTTSTTNNDKIVSISGQINMTIHPLLEGVFDGWKNGVPHTQYELKGKDGESYYKAISGELSYKLPITGVIRDRHFNTCFMFNEGALFAFTKTEVPASAVSIFKRFAKVFELTYQRYRELIESEKRAKEAKKQSSLDRVRGEIASMRSTEDLSKITPIIWQELTNMEVPFFRCGVFIMNEENKNIQVYLSDPKGKSLGLMNLDSSTSELTKNTFKAWRNQNVFKTHWDKKEFTDWTKSLIDLGKIDTEEGYQGGGDPPESLDLHFVPFKQGMLYVGNLESLLEDQIKLVRNLAESFSIAYSRYEDFVKLEKAKESVEGALIDLKATQKQLIQSEKMASLGELTAGIAHEIQNPLNFVNNFSEVSNELIDEMNEEIENGDLEEAKLIANDIKQNLEKINHHGKRADAIVKGMLQHSRKGTAEKEPTDINKLADEYLRLAYHGLRAKDKSFNATLETDFDESIGLVNVFPQDIGRVILNLITNAFYAVKEKSTLDDGSENGVYKPTVSITTLAKSDSINIIVKDNGKGIPNNALDKIFQPFFTTKPTGEGTGLGLSMSYDIVTKGHGGMLTVETKEGKGTKFIVQLPLKEIA